MWAAYSFVINFVRITFVLLPSMALFSVSFDTRLNECCPVENIRFPQIDAEWKIDLGCMVIFWCRCGFSFESLGEKQERAKSRTVRVVVVEERKDGADNGRGE